MTNLLPRSRKDFADKKYWDDFFLKRGSLSFEWYGEYIELCSILHKYIHFNDKLLVVGCGNSALSADLYDAGYHNNINVDISQVVIQQMTNKYSSTRPGLIFTKMDIEKMEYGDEEFTVVLDKGTLDALMPDEGSMQKATMVLTEIARVLKFGGRYLCCSLLQEHIMKTLFGWCTQQGWMLRVHYCLDVEEASRARGQTVTFPTFMVVCTKVRKIPEMPMVLEHIGFEWESRATRVSSLEDLYDAVHSVQQYCLLRHKLNSSRWVREEMSVDFHLASSSIANPRYRVFVVDRHDCCDIKFAVFIVPQGRETDWMFGTLEGRRVLAESAKSCRLLVVHLHRDHSYESLDQVKSDLSQRVMEFVPLDYDPEDKVPFLSLGENVGERSLVHRGHSQMTGDYIVEDIRADGAFFRKLVFLSNPNVVQSEARLVSETRKKSQKKKLGRLRVDHSYLACQHHQLMLLGTSLAANPFETDGCVNALLVGLGGGGLPSYVLRQMPNVNLDVVEIDEEVVSIATKYFDLDSSNKRLKLLIRDGVDFVFAAAREGKHYDMLMLDVDNKDSGSGLSVPPPSFLAKDFLSAIHDLVTPNGVFVLNLVCRDVELKETILNSLRKVFGHVHSQNVPEEVNQVVYALSSVAELPPKDALTSMVRQIASGFKGNKVNLKDWLQSVYSEKGDSTI